MTQIAEAARVVGTARRRLALAARLRAACDGVAGGALVALLAWGALALLGTSSPVWLLFGLPAAAAVLMAVTCPGGFISTERAALALDRAAHTDEAFVSALTAEDASEGMRELSAQWALSRCAGAQVARVLPFESPRGAPRAVLGGALLAAVLLVPAGSEAGATDRGGGERVSIPARSGAASAATDSPADRARALVEALQAPSTETDRLTAAVRQDVPALSADDLAQLARALADAGLGERSEAARRALAALGAGDPDRAATELRTALGGAVPSVPGSNPGGAAALPSTGEDATPARRGASAWPLRYDRTVRRWFELERTAPGSGSGGGR